MKYSKRTKLLCLRCNILSEDLKSSKRASHRELDGTMSLLTYYDARIRTEEYICGYRPAASLVVKEVAHQKLDDLFVNPVLPALSDFPFVWTTPYLDVY